jgi:Predicted cobalamin binding protein
MTTVQSNPLQQKPADSTPGFQAGPLDLTSLRRQWVSAVTDFNKPKADEILDHAFETHSPETVCLEVLLAGLREVGDLWYAGEISVSQEHFASAHAMRRVEALIQSASVSCHTNCVLVAAPPLENHCFNLLLLTFLLLRYGREVVYLGANLPLEWMDATIKRLRPCWVITASQYLPSCAGVLELAGFLKERGVPLGYVD